MEEKQIPQPPCQCDDGTEIVPYEESTPYMDDSNEEKGGIYIGENQNPDGGHADHHGYGGQHENPYGAEGGHKGEPEEQDEGTWMKGYEEKNENKHDYEHHSYEEYEDEDHNESDYEIKNKPDSPGWRFRNRLGVKLEASDIPPRH